MTITTPITDTATSGTQSPAVTLRDVIEGQTAGHLIVAADDYDWWTTLLADTPIQPTSAIENVVADGLIRAGLLAGSPAGILLTDAGREVAHNRGFVRVAVRGWEPTFRQLSAQRGADHIPAATEPGDVARGCTDIARRCPEILSGVGGAIAAGTPGITIDLGCADAGRIALLSQIATEETFIGVDIEDGVIADATAEMGSRGLSDRVRLLAGSVQPGAEMPAWLDDVDREAVTTAMSFFLLHQLASDGGGIAPVLARWMEWFPNLTRLVIGDGIRLTAPRWTGQPWFSPTYEIYHAITGVQLWSDAEYETAFADLGWTLTQRHSDHTMLVTSILERSADSR
ncbi:hypothetical protein OG579_12445 [Williamsia herbipolensis]|uniref:Methyltransferase domain-containing protein n=1 Tax=Williamsia herbipolensis TaxID=1603258 RepID=A0AAU4JXP1_9NOCA|nr:hypothetical protein [Williamsia herbipolensis]